MHTERATSLLEVLMLEGKGREQSQTLPMFSLLQMITFAVIILPFLFVCWLVSGLFCFVAVVFVLCCCF